MKYFVLLMALVLVGCEKEKLLAPKSLNGVKVEKEESLGLIIKTSYVPPYSDGDGNTQVARLDIQSEKGGVIVQWGKDTPMPLGLINTELKVYQGTLGGKTVTWAEVLGVKRKVVAW